MTERPMRNSPNPTGSLWLEAERLRKERDERRNQPKSKPLPSFRDDVWRLLNKRWTIILHCRGCYVMFAEKPPEALVLSPYECKKMVDDETIRHLSTKNAGALEIDIFVTNLA